MQGQQHPAPPTGGNCARCGDFNSFELIICGGCGARLPWAAQAEAHRQAQRQHEEQARQQHALVQQQAAQAARGAASQRVLGKQVQLPPPDYQVLAYIGDGWHYDAGGRQIGPVTAAQVWGLVQSRKIGRDTMVWRDGMPDWQAAGIGLLDAVFQRALAGLPPPAPPRELNNTYVWILAFMPLLSLFIMGMMAATWRQPYYNFWWVPVALNTVLCIADERAVKAAGHPTGGLVVLALIFVPAYLFLRASRVDESPVYAWVWFITFLVMVAPVPMQFYYVIPMPR